MDGGPVGGHVDHGPSVLGGGGEDLSGAAVQDGVAVVGVLALVVGVADDQLQRPMRAGCSPLEHGQVAVGVPGGHDRPLPDVLVDRARLAGTVIDNLDGGVLDELGTSLADTELGFSGAADHPVRRQAVDVCDGGPHEIRSAPGEDPAGKAAAAQIVEQLQHRLVHGLRVGPSETRMSSGRQPIAAQNVELIGRDARVREPDEVGQGIHPARLQFFETHGMAQLGRPIQRKCQLGVQGLLGPQRAVVVEHSDAIRLRDEVRRVAVGHRGDELQDRPLGRARTPARQSIAAHAMPSLSVRVPTGRRLQPRAVHLCCGGPVWSVISSRGARTRVVGSVESRSGGPWP